MTAHDPDHHQPLIACLGGGQLGRMLALEAHRMGVRTRCFDPAPDACAGQVCPLYVADWHDAETLADFLSGVDGVTYEFERVPVDTARLATELVSEEKLRPGVESLRIAQDRLLEKQLFASVGIDTPGYARIDSEDDLRRAAHELGLPCILKTRRGGYDGRGQVRINASADLDDALDPIDFQPAILERRIDFQRELSLISARTADGQVLHFPLVENHHIAGILSHTVAPAPGVPETARDWAHAHAERLLAALDHVGVLTIEFFDTGDRLLGNELAPRVHNSGHWTQNACHTSQFEQHLRAVLDLPLGPVGVRGPAAMVNLIGAVPPRRDLLAIPHSAVHLYGKAPRQGRKLGHVNIAADSAADRDEALERVLRLIDSD
jgi:5-(carboxyamino)imidazole ribonucleotide synthase